MPDDTRSLHFDAAALPARPLDPQPVPVDDPSGSPAIPAIQPLAGPATPPAASPLGTRPSNAALYIGVRLKFVLALGVSLGWLAFSIAVARPWIGSLGALVGHALALMIVGGIALVPGFMNAFLISSLLLDRRPRRRDFDVWPAVSVLIAAYNEEGSIVDTLRSLAGQNYPGPFEVLVIDDGSRDRTAELVAACKYPWLRLLRQPSNAGKAAALNRGLAESTHDIVVTLDADSYLYRDALKNLVGRYLSDPAHTRAVAGTMLVRNSRRNWVTRAQEWDYFHGIAAIKRVQSLYQGTLVAQGAFSVYDRAALVEAGGWENCVGEDIVLTWALLSRGYRVGHAEDACCFTNAPDTLGQFVRQRQRWSRGMIEAFRKYPGILLKPRLSTMFVWWNVLFPWLDLAYTVFFIPGMLLAFFGVFWIAGPLTFVLLPMALLVNLVMYRVGSRMFAQSGLRVRRNVAGFLVYAFVYSLILQPACVAGYLAEIAGLRKTWGTK